MKDLTPSLASLIQQRNSELRLVKQSLLNALLSDFTTHTNVCSFLTIKLFLFILTNFSLRHKHLK